MFTIAIQYPGFGPQHPPRLKAIVDECPHPQARVVAMEMFSVDSDYDWAPVPTEGACFERHTVMNCTSEQGRKAGSTLRQSVWNNLNSIKPDVLVVNGWGHKESQHSLTWARRNRCRIVLLNDSTYEDAPRRWYKEITKRWIVRGSQAAFVAGSPQARYAARLGIPAARIFHPGSCVVDNDYWHAKSEAARQNAGELRQKLGLPERYFLYVGRFIEKKNVPFLVRAYGRYRRKAGQNAIGLVLCGDGPERERIVSEANQLGLNDVVFPGFSQVDSLPAFYGLASCFVMPSSHFEQWGLVANEAMACGLPVLVSERCGNSEDLIEDAVNGYRFAPSNEEQLSELMHRVAGDESQQRRLGRESQRIIAGHSCTIAAKNLWKAVDAARAA